MFAKVGVSALLQLPHGEIPYAEVVDNKTYVPCSVEGTGLLWPQPDRLPDFFTYLVVAAEEVWSDNGRSVAQVVCLKDGLPLTPFLMELNSDGFPRYVFSSKTLIVVTVHEVGTLDVEEYSVNKEHSEGWKLSSSPLCRYHLPEGVLNPDSVLKDLPIKIANYAQAIELALIKFQERIPRVLYAEPWE